MNFKVFAVMIAFVLAMCAASPVVEPQQAEIGMNSMEKFKICVMPKLLFDFIFFRIDPPVEQLFTCDVLGSTRLCAIHCMILDHKGGYCNEQKVCKCRD